MRICFLMEPPSSRFSVTHALLRSLRNGGATVDIVAGRDGPIQIGQLAVGYDLYLFKSHSPMAESLAAALHARGAPLLNAYPATMKVRDKVVTSALLWDAGIATPLAFVAESLEQLRPIVPHTRLIVKPHRGRRGQGLEMCLDEDQLRSLIARRDDHSAQGPAPAEASGDRLVFAQEYLDHEPFDYKAYAIGDFVYAIRRVFPATTEGEKLGTPVGDDPELADVVRRCGRLFGLELYGVDLVRTRAGFSVIEVNCFPGYKGVPDAGERLARFILDRLTELAGARHPAARTIRTPRTTTMASTYSSLGDRAP